MDVACTVPCHVTTRKTMSSWSYITGFLSDEKLEAFYGDEDLHVVVFWVVTSCSHVVGYQRFGGPYCLHLHEDFFLFSLHIRGSIIQITLDFNLCIIFYVRCHK